MSATNKLFSGFLWSFGSVGANVIIRIVVLAVLARKLTPEIYGIFSVFSMISGFFEFFGRAWIQNNIISRKDIHEDDFINTTFTFGLINSLLLILLMAPLGYYIFSQFDVPDPSQLTLFTVIAIAFYGFAIVNISILRKTLKFKTIAKIDVITNILCQAIPSLIMAFLGYGLMALIIPTLFQLFVRSLMLFLSQPLKLKLRINKKAAKVLISNYWSLNSGVFMNYFATRGDNLIVGRFIGTEALGFYGRAFNIAKMPTNLFGSTMDKVLFPILASNDVSDENRKKSFLLLSFIISLFGLTLSLLLTTFSAQIVSIILGPQWIGVSGLLGILGFATFFRLAYKISISQLLVQRKFRMLSNMQITITIIMLILCYLGTYLGVEYVAGATTLAIILQYTYLNIIACKEIGVNLKEFIEAHRLPLLFTTCSTIIIGLMHYWVPDVLSSNYFFFAYSIALFVLIGLILFAIPSSNEYTNWWRQKISEFLFKKKKRKNN